MPVEIGKVVEGHCNPGLRILVLLFNFRKDRQAYAIYRKY